MHVPELTTRLQNPQVQYSPGSTTIMEPSPLSKTPLGLTFYHTLSVSPGKYQLQALIHPGHDLQIGNQ